jgi:ABC-2 type transport system ATP-binding protein
MNGIAIQTTNLSRDFLKLRALDNLTIEVPVGQIFGLLGPNGAGKTTTIRLLLGLLSPSQGKAVVLGYDIHNAADQIRHCSGALLEHHGLYERMSAEDNLEFYARAWHIPAEQKRRRIQELLQSLNLWDRRKEIILEWSRGMKQKLAVARTLLHRPPLVFLDEPTSGLDPIAAVALRDDLIALADTEGVTIFLTTHNLIEAEKLCHQVAVIRQGRLLAVGTPDTLRNRHHLHRVIVNGRGFDETLLADLGQRPGIVAAQIRNSHLEIDLTAETTTAPLVSWLVQCGVTVEEVYKEKASLEDVFMALMEEDTC